MYIRKRNGKWQCVVRVQGIAKAQSFISKADARKWGNKQEAQIRLGTYFDERSFISIAPPMTLAVPYCPLTCNTAVIAFVASIIMNLPTGWFCPGQGILAKILYFGKICMFIL